MSIASLTPDEREVVRRTMEAACRYFSDDFNARLGVEPEKMRSMLDSWPIDDSDDNSDACLAVNNSFNDLLFGVGISEAAALQLVGVPRAEMERVYVKWSAARGWHKTGLR